MDFGQRFKSATESEWLLSELFKKFLAGSFYIDEYYKFDYILLRNWQTDNTDGHLAG